MLSSLPLSFALLVTLVIASPSPNTPSSSQHIPLKRRTPQRTSEEFAEWAKNHRDMLKTKYGAPSRKRASGTNLITNQNSDSSFFGSLAIGTPPVAFDVILDTGSADLWVADSDCITGCPAVATFDPASSSTFTNKSSSFSIQYGSGQAAGVLGEDIVQMAGFSVSNQIFGVCDRISRGLLNSPVSGLLGLAFQTIASSGAVPLWETLVSSGAWDQPLMAFQLTRYTNASSVNSLEPGGTFTMGAVNTSLYTGDIDYVDIPSGQGTYWILPLTTLTAQGTSVEIPTGQSSYAAIDTGTTLVGGPSDAIANLYAQIPNSQQGTGNFEGYWLYPCSTSVDITLSFGSRSWSLSPADFNIGTASGGRCVGAFFEISTSSNAPSWIVGDTFLKNVYSVFRYLPPSVGFANLSATAVAQNGADGAVPSPTIGSAAATVSATGRSRVSNGSSRLMAPWVGIVAGLVCLMMVW